MKTRKVILTFSLITLLLSTTLIVSAANVVKDGTFDDDEWISWPNFQKDWVGTENNNWKERRTLTENNWVYHVEKAEEVIAKRWQTISPVSISNLNTPSSLSFNYWLPRMGVDIFGVGVSDGINNLFMVVAGTTSIQSDTTIIISEDVTEGTWLSASANVYSMWISLGYPNDADIIQVILYTEDQSLVTGYTAYFLDNVFLNKVTSGGGGGSGGEFCVTVMC